MCGIAGVVNADLRAQDIDALIRRMNRAMTHRGPDEEGHAVFGEERAGLSARRLSIVDVANGHQPAANEDGSVHVVFNGEIYNHGDLRERLRQKGHVFASRCDTEVIAHLYEEFGDDCVRHLDGMFALAVFDKRRRRLLLARDGPGMKPLYVAETPRGLLFASEIKALLATGWVAARPDLRAIDAYLSFGYFPTPLCGFEGIRKLPPGHRLVADGGGVARECFWRYECRTDEPPRRDEEYGEELETLLRRAVRTHLAADVPVGSLVSGGWDSSLVTTFAALEANVRLKTFSIVFPEDKERDESRYSRLLARRLGTEHHEIEARADDIPELLQKAVPFLEEPVAASPALLIYVVSSLAARHVKTVLTGEGADELFAGYPWLQSRRFRKPEPAHSFRERLAAWMRGRRRADARSAHQDVRQGRDGRPTLADLVTLDADQKHAILLPEFRAPRSASDGRSLDPDAATACGGGLQARMALEFTAQLPDRVLLHVDKMSMAHSLEARMPFLDRSIVHFAERLPANLKIRGRQKKYVLSLLARHLPPAIAKRRKKGLMYPQSRLRTGPAAETLRGMLLDGAARGGPFDREALETLARDWIRPGQPLGKRPLLLVFLQLWWNTFISP